MYAERRDLYRRLAEMRGSAVLTYVTGDRAGAEAQIAHDAIEFFGNIIDHYQGAKRITLFLYTRGGETLAAWSLVNLLREFCDDIEIVIPSKCLSSGTLICLGANRLLMTKQATLGPIDPSTNSPINPEIPGVPLNQRLPVSVEDVAGFFEMARKEAKVGRQEYLIEVFNKLADHVHPIALGRVMRARGQIHDLARKLLGTHMKEGRAMDRIVRVLCNEAGSHDYVIYRSEARNLGLDIETPSMELYELIRAIYTDIRAEMKLLEPFAPESELCVPETKDFELRRVLIESQEHGGYHFVTKLTMSKLQSPQGPPILQREHLIDAWEYVP